MMKKIKKIFTTYKLTFLVAAIVLVLGVLSLVLIKTLGNKDLIKELSNDFYLVKYDNSWKIDKQKDNLIIFKHKKSNSSLQLEIVDIEDDYAYRSIDDLIDEVTYSLEESNPDYHLISKQEEQFTQYEDLGYKYLYENGKSQVLVIVYKHSDKLVIGTYEADNDYFDILLDSVQNIIYNFNVKEETFPIATELDIKLNDINYYQGKELAGKFTKTKEYEVASNHYYVSYSIPTEFTMRYIVLRYNNFAYEDADSGASIEINTNIYLSNIYEYFSKDSAINAYETYKAKDDDYKNFKEVVGPLKSDYESFIYKNTYDSTCHRYNEDFEYIEYDCHNETVKLAYALNRNHIFVVEIRAKETGVPKELVNSIKINKIKNYPTYVINHDDGTNIISELKTYKDYKQEKILKVSLKVPNSYEEYDNDFEDLYRQKKFRYNYNESTDLYDYTVNYDLTNYVDYDQMIASRNSSITISKSLKFNPYKKEGNLTFNGKTFAVYSGGEEALGGVMFTNVNRFKYYINKKMLFYKVDDDKMLMIEIKGNGKSISKGVLNALTNFDVSEEENN